MPDGVSVHMNAFEGVDEPMRAIARDYEIRAREIRRAAKVFRETYLGMGTVVENLEARRAHERRSGSGLVREV
ncbi:MAG: hypothetical protein DI556_13470 [Rhodovulum sulfidophilum]|uniref:Uncharacterized protein n=1 Tax=Rhodovulum sulfidophilum TaxID=35806 RepID=A0A2W5N960_RHOSU|nr:MAG: hypothetical protein DI556_13470 [Rhodovulum sulfidophilum]